jgi:Protein of unknown function (DUF3617)
MQSANTSFRLGCAAIAAVMASSAALGATPTVPGEKWQQTITMKMEGMSMPMGSTEICAPIGRADEELLKPEKDCKVSNVKRSGNRLSGDIACSGKDPIKGTMVLVSEANRVTGTMQVTMDGETVTMTMDSRKLGACQAIDTQALVDRSVAEGKRAAAAAPKVDACATVTEDLKSKPDNTAFAATIFAAPGAQCAGSVHKAPFCAAVQTRSGFSSLQQMEANRASITAQSASFCGLGAGKAGVDALRARLVTAAEADGDGNFLITHAPARARQLARSECVLKGEMWGGKSARWDSFCDSNFAADARGGR